MSHCISVSTQNVAPPLHMDAEVSPRCPKGQQRMFLGGAGEMSSSPSKCCKDVKTTVTQQHVQQPGEHPLYLQDTGPAVTPGPALCAEARGAAQRLLDHYVQVQGAAVAQMLRKSVETRDWLGTVEPRNVRAVMKRVVEDITAIDVQVRATLSLRGVPWCP